MITNAQNNQNELLSILDQMFAWNRNRSDDTKQIIIAPDLNEEKLDKLIGEARNIIIKCYTTCESDFIAGLEIFEGIVEKQIMDVTKSQIDILEKTIHSTLSEGPASEKTEHTVSEAVPTESESAATPAESEAAATPEEVKPEEVKPDSKPIEEKTIQENKDIESIIDNDKPKIESEHITETFINPPIKSDVVKKRESIEPTYVPTDTTTIVYTDELISETKSDIE